MTTATNDGPVAGRVSRGLGWGLGGTIAMRVGSVLFGILVARLVAPEEFGVYAVALTVWTILSTLADLGLGADLVRAADMEPRAPTVASIGLGVSVSLGVTMVLAAEPIALAFGSPESVDVIRLMAVSIAVFGFTIVPSARLTRAYRQGALFGINALGLLASVVVSLGLILGGVGAEALACGQIACQSVIAVGLFVVTRTVPRLGYDPALARESLVFCLPLAAANLLSWLLLSLDNLIVSRTLGPEQLGLYVLAFNISSWPMSALGAAIRVVALPAFSQASSPEVRNRGLVLCIAPLVTVSTLISLGLAAAAIPLVTLIYGDRWEPAAAALTGLAVFGGSRVLLDLVATFLVAAGETRAVLAVQVAWVLAMVPAMVLGVTRWGLAGAGWTHVAVVVAVVVPLYLRALGKVGIPPGELLRPVVVPLVAAVPAAIACIWFNGLGSNRLLTLVGVAALVLALYGLPLLRWWRARFTQLRRLEPVSVPEGTPS
ncbi:oligosaccharide flippase family protein [Nocardioides sp. KC13]|uniref:Oligosaccharide flippase family protein n=1 Tax=Nocardioides turkmenicus TaxID=2711220 RepID=A0A6M1QYP1_9ACTN|nr:oligosaccharide flippase family protein [Nocardioides sp. KC13]NGN93034.1 oligosaccharide flippase family protein [Nocardioides sp. KC13]